jgi:hypothetical protein
MPSIPVVVAETLVFQRTASAIMSAVEVHELIDYLARHPTAGDVIQGTGGIRKLRWRRPGMGKRGGARIVYYHHDDTMPVFLLLAYAKSSAADISADQKRRIADLVVELVRSHKER